MEQWPSRTILRQENMRLICLRWLAASSLLLAALGASAAARPRYGGTLRISSAAAFTSLDPAAPGQADSLVRRNITRLLFETLVAVDERGVLQPSLADTWASNSGGRQWTFSLRHGISFSDGSPLTADAAAAALRASNSTWKVTAQGNTITIETEASVMDLPTELALPRNAILERSTRLLGTGPFVVEQWDPGHKLKLVARDDYRGGRPFLDAIELELNQSAREQGIAFDLGRTDLIEIPLEQSRRVASEGRRLTTSSPMELMALVFSRDAQSPAEQKVREALSLSVDRALMNRVLFQNEAESAGGLLPNWMSGYGFVFATAVNQERARQLRTEAGAFRGWTLGYSGGDTLARVVAERVSLNARDIGLSVQVTTAATADIRLVRIPLTLADGRIELGEICTALEIGPANVADSSVESAYAGENTSLQSRRVIPLFHLRYVWGVGMGLEDWRINRDGSWDLPDVWLSGKP
jgi:peptide/nickel transport system substrate-binding protein